MLSTHKRLWSCLNKSLVNDESLTRWGCWHLRYLTGLSNIDKLGLTRFIIRVAVSRIDRFLASNSVYQKQILVSQESQVLILQLLRVLRNAGNKIDFPRAAMLLLPYWPGQWFLVSFRKGSANLSDCGFWSVNAAWVEVELSLHFMQLPPLHSVVNVSQKHWPAGQTTWRSS